MQRLVAAHRRNRGRSHIRSIGCSLGIHMHCNVYRDILSAPPYIALVGKNEEDVCRADTIVAHTGRISLPRTQCPELLERCSVCRRACADRGHEFGNLVQHANESSDLVFMRVIDVYVSVLQCVTYAVLRPSIQGLHAKSLCTITA